MAYSKNFLQLTWGGSYFTEDIWINGLHIIATGVGPGDEVNQAFNASALGDISDEIIEAHTHAAGNSSSATLEWFKLALIGTDGKYIGDPIVVDIPATPGGRLGAMYPQLATAISLRTAKKRGPSAFGRYYVPAAPAVLDSGRVGNGDVDSLLGVQYRMLQGINVALSLNVVGNFIHVGNVSKVGAGSQERVTGVFVGDIVDTQRRRRNKMNETYRGLSL